MTKQQQLQKILVHIDRTNKEVRVGMLISKGFHQHMIRSTAQKCGLFIYEDGEGYSVVGKKNVRRWINSYYHEVMVRGSVIKERGESIDY